MISPNRIKVAENTYSRRLAKAGNDKRLAFFGTYDCRRIEQLKSRVGEQTVAPRPACLQIHP
jgi:hypothetical protein